MSLPAPGSVLRHQCGKLYAVIEGEDHKRLIVPVTPHGRELNPETYKIQVYNFPTWSDGKLLSLYTVIYDPED